MTETSEINAEEVTKMADDYIATVVRGPVENLRAKRAFIQSSWYFLNRELYQLEAQILRLKSRRKVLRGDQALAAKLKSDLGELIRKEEADESNDSVGSQSPS